MVCFRPLCLNLSDFVLCPAQYLYIAIIFFYFVQINDRDTITLNAFILCSKTDDDVDGGGDDDDDDDDDDSGGGDHDDDDDNGGGGGDLMT